MDTVFLIDSALSSSGKHSSQTQFKIGKPNNALMKKFGSSEIIMGTEFEGQYFVHATGIYNFYVIRTNQKDNANIFCHPNCYALDPDGTSIENYCGGKAQDATACQLYTGKTIKPCETGKTGTPNLASALRSDGAMKCSITRSSSDAPN